MTKLKLGKFRPCLTELSNIVTTIKPPKSPPISSDVLKP